MARISTEECRRILGPEAVNMTDGDIEKLLDSLEQAADALYAKMTADLQEGRASLEEWREAALTDGESIPSWLNTTESKQSETQSSAYVGSLTTKRQGSTSDAEIRHLLPRV